jgi:WD40 repeat protein
MNIWNVTGDTARLANRFAFPFCGDYPLPCMLSWSPDNRLIGANRIPSAEIWDPVTGTQVAQLPGADVHWTDEGYEGLPFLSAYRHDGSLLARLTDGRDAIEIRDVASDELVLSIPAGRVFRFTWSPTGQQLAVLDVEEPKLELPLWNVRSGD